MTAREYKVVCVRESNVPTVAVVSAVSVTTTFRAWIRDASWFDPMKECLVVALLNTKNRLLGFNLVSLGTLNSSLAHPREVFRAAIIQAADGIIVLHNHPSGDPFPSVADASVTRQLLNAARVLDIRFLDHIIVGEPSEDPKGLGYFSFLDAGAMENPFAPLYPPRRRRKQATITKPAPKCEPEKSVAA